MIIFKSILTLQNWALYFEATGAVVKISLNLKPNPYTVTKFSLIKSVEEKWLSFDQGF